MTISREDELKLAQRVYDGKFELLCPKIQLLVCPGYHDVWAEGTGVIRQDERGRLTFQIVALSGNTNRLPQRRKVQPGEYYDDEDRVMLCATDESGHEWRSNCFVPNEPSLPFAKWQIFGELVSLGSGRERIQHEHSEVRIFVRSREFLPFEYPTETVVRTEKEQLSRTVERNRHLRKVGSIEMEFRSEEKQWLIVTAASESTVGPLMTGHICQALSYALARVVRPVVDIREFENQYRITLTSGPFLNFSSHLTMPLIGWTLVNNVWELVHRFIEWTDQNQAKSSLLFDELDGIRSGGTGSLSTAALTLSIGIDAIAQLLLPYEAAKPLNEGERKLVEALRTTVKTSDAGSNFKSRVLGSMGHLTGKPSTSDRIHAFLVKSDLPIAFLRDWKALRNERAHALDSGDEQRLSKLYYSSVELLYRIVSEATGYKGKITKTSEAGWGM